MNKYFANWKTTSAGILALVTALTRLGFAVKQGGLTEEAITTSAIAILSGIGLLFARDYNVSSEQSGVKVDPTVTVNTEPPKT